MKTKISLNAKKRLVSSISQYLNGFGDTGSTIDKLFPLAASELKWTFCTLLLTITKRRSHHDHLQTLRSKEFKFIMNGIMKLFWFWCPQAGELLKKIYFLHFIVCSCFPFLCHEVSEEILRDSCFLSEKSYKYLVIRLLSENKNPLEILMSLAWFVVRYVPQEKNTKANFCCIWWNYLVVSKISKVI